MVSNSLRYSRVEKLRSVIDTEESSSAFLQFNEKVLLQFSQYFQSFWEKKLNFLSVIESRKYQNPN